MDKDYVDRNEFNQLKEEVNEIKADLTKSTELLQKIDKKIDIIDTKVVTADKIDDLKLTPLEKRVDTLEKRTDTIEEGNKWLRRTIATTVIGVVIGALVFVIKMM